MTHWNHRIVKQMIELGQEEFPTYGLHEVFYDESGAPGSWTKEPVAIVGDDFKETAETFMRMSQAFFKPVLVVVDGKLAESSEEGISA